MDNQDNLYLLLGRIDGKLDAALQRQDHHEENVERLGIRVRTLEQSKAYLLGISAAIAFLVSSLDTIKQFFFGG